MQLNLHTRLPRVPVLEGRHDFILQHVVGKDVLHVGCVDAGVLGPRFERGELMHQRLAAVTGDLWGMDVDSDGIDFLRGHGFDHLFTGDICTPEGWAQLDGRTFDVILASEVVEHLMDVGAFLKNVQQAMRPDHTELIITVPNAFRLSTLMGLLRGEEFVHPDHNYWFSYVTATNLLRKSGLTLTDLYVYSMQPWRLRPGRAAGSGPSVAPIGTGQARASNGPSFVQRGMAYVFSLPKRILLSWLFRRTPFWGDGLILVAQVRSHAE